MLMRRLLVLSAVLVLFSCGVDSVDISEYNMDSDLGTLGFDMPMMTQAQMANTQIYVFNGTGADAGKYVYRIPGFTSSGNTLSMNARVGEWDMVLVNAEQSVLSRLTQPNYAVGATMNNSEMWETTPSAGVLPSTPEIMTAHIDNQQVIANTTNYGNGDLVRNVAMVRLVIDEAGGLALGGGAGINHRVQLGKVPTTLSWAGGLLPSRQAPHTSSSPMTGELTVLQDPQNPQNQISDTLTFIIPAHKGSDYWLTNPKDTTTNKLTLSIDFKTQSGGRYVKNNVEIPVTPKMNKILIVRMSVKAQLSFETNVYDWTTEYVNADVVTQTTIEVSKTNVALAVGSETVHVTTSTDYTLTPSANWLSATKLGNGQIQITASGLGWNYSNRQGYISVTANNLTKRIHVTQRPDVGPLSVSADAIWLYDAFPTRQVTINSSKGGWQIMAAPQKVTPNITSATGSATVTFTRKSTTNESEYNTVYGDETITILNTTTLEHKTIAVHNLFLKGPEKINVNGAGGITYNDEIIAIGGSGQYVVGSVIYPNGVPFWLNNVSIENGRLKLVADPEPNEQVRSCKLTLTHADEGGYYTSIVIEQNPFIDIIEPFTNLVGQFRIYDTYDPPHADIDIAVMVYSDDLSAPGQGKPGYSLLPRTSPMDGFFGYHNDLMANRPNAVYNGELIGLWGGDPGSSAYAGMDCGESFVLYVNKFDDYDIFPEDVLSRYINIYIYARWYNGVYTYSTTHRATLELEYWDGGEIVSVPSSSYSFIYRNNGGENKNPNPEPVDVNLTARNSPGQVNFEDVVGGAQKILRVRYDRLTHKAEATWFKDNPGDASKWPTSYNSLSMPWSPLSAPSAPPSSSTREPSGRRPSSGGAAK